MLDGVSDRYGFLGGDIVEPLSTGDYTLVAEVTHCFILCHTYL